MQVGHPMASAAGTNLDIDALKRQYVVRTPGRGMIVAIGGAEDKEGNRDILRAFVELAGGANARIALIPTASSDPEDAANEYTQVFRELGVDEVRVVEARTPEAADSDQAVEVLSNATGIFISGGDQNRLAEIFCGTRSHRCIIERNASGVVVGGTSAGAAIMASHMVGGGESGATPFKSMSGVEEGFGLLHNIVVDTHFGARGRTGRLMAMHAGLPELIAIGLDEDTAAVIDEDMIMQVIGSGAVTIVDGSSIRSDLDDIGDDDPIMINGIELHTVTPRYQFDLRARKFLPPLKTTDVHPQQEA